MSTCSSSHWPRSGVTASVAVVLSGTGSDGANGLRSIRSAGGLTMVQSPQSAGFDGMPRAAIALGSVDLVADASQLGRAAGRADTRVRGNRGCAPARASDEAFPAITTQLQRSTGHRLLGLQGRRRCAGRCSAAWRSGRSRDIDAYLAVLG